eukprot:2363142-Prymnesium_polylepis.2
MASRSPVRRRLRCLRQRVRLRRHRSSGLRHARPRACHPRRPGPTALLHARPPRRPRCVASAP